MIKYFFSLILSIIIFTYPHITFSTEYIRPSNLDSEAAYAIYLLNNNIYKKQNEELAKSALQKIQNSIVFKDFSPWAKQVFQTFNFFNSTQLKKHCIADISPTPLSKITDSLFLKICYKNYLSVLANESLINTKIEEETKEFITSIVPAFFTKEAQETLALFMNKIFQKSAIHIEYSRLISQAFMKNNIVPEQSLLKELHISYELTQFIQQQGFNLPQTQKVFSQELDELSRKVVTAIGKDNDNLKRNLGYFLKFYQNNNKYLTQKSVKSRLLFTGKELSLAGYFAEAQTVLNHIVKDRDTEISHEALFITLWSLLMQNNTDKAYDFADDNNLFDLFPSLSLKLKYWIAYTAELNKKKGQATKFYKQLIELHPLSFYSMMAIKNIAKLTKEENFPEGFINQNTNQAVPTINDLSALVHSSLIRLKLWDQYNLKEFRENEVNQLSNEDVEKLKNDQSKFPDTYIRESLFAFMARMFAQNNNYILGFNLIQQALAEKKISPNSHILNSLFPKLYIEEIKKFDTNLDPIILLSLIRQESGFNPKAKSQVGARGLMQLMPTTAKMMNRKIQPLDLEKPETNLKLGIQYFKYLMKKYDGNLVFSLAAYNAGENRVSRWQKELFTKDENMLHTIEKIPYQETRDYVKLIFRNMYFYKYLASNKLDHGHFAKIYDIDLGFKH